MVNAYNQSFHRSIGISPDAATLKENWELVSRNQFESRVTENKKYLTSKEWPKLQKGELVWVKTEVGRKKNEPRFREIAEVLEIKEFDIYILRMEKEVDLKGKYRN